MQWVVNAPPCCVTQRVSVVGEILLNMGNDVSDADYNNWVERLKQLNDKPEFAEIREARGLFPIQKFGADFDTYVKDQVADFKNLAKEVGLTK